MKLQGLAAGWSRQERLRETDSVQGRFIFQITLVLCRDEIISPNNSSDINYLQEINISVEQENYFSSKCQVGNLANTVSGVFQISLPHPITFTDIPNDLVIKMKASIPIVRVFYHHILLLEGWVFKILGFSNCQISLSF